MLGGGHFRDGPGSEIRTMSAAKGVDSNLYADAAAGGGTDGRAVPALARFPRAAGAAAHGLPCGCRRVPSRGATAWARGGCRGAARACAGGAGGLERQVRRHVPPGGPATGVCTGSVRAVVEAEADARWSCSSPGPTISASYTATWEGLRRFQHILCQCF